MARRGNDPLHQRADPPRVPVGRDKARGAERSGPIATGRAGQRAAFRTRLWTLEENLKVADRLLVLLGEVSCAGKQVHDANIVATMLVHGIDTIATMNAAGYARFSDHIAVLPFR